jgi:hypothetical protein
MMLTIASTVRSSVKLQPCSCISDSLGMPNSRRGIILTRLNVVSKTRAHAGHTQMIECFGRSASGIPRKFTQFRVVTCKHGGGAGRILAKKEEVNKRITSLFRYRDSLEEIQGEC